MPPLHILIKPVSGSCNLRCKYCFYEDETNKRSVASYGMMSTETFNLIAEKALQKAEHSCTFAFQGGEPTLAGLEFYKKLIDIVNSNNHKKLSIGYTIQTNGILIDRDWVEFFKKNNFLVGLSLDGIKDVNDELRIDSKKNGTYSKIMHTAQLFSSNCVEFNVLTVVTSNLAKNINKVFNFFMRNNFIYQQYIPCLDPLGETRGQFPHSLTPHIYGKFLCDLFDLYYANIMNGKLLSIRYFDNLIWMLRGYPPESCNMNGHCSSQYLIEADGSVFPCDFYAVDEYKLGNMSDGFDFLDKKCDEINFIKNSKNIVPQCNNCNYFSLCRGGCRRDRDFFNGELELNYYCESFKRFFDYSYKRLLDIEKFTRAYI